MATPVPDPLSSRLSALLDRHEVGSTARLIDAIADRYRQAAALFGFAPPPHAASADAHLEAIAPDLIDLATRQGDLSSLQDILLAVSGPEDIRALWQGTHAREQIAAGPSGADTMVAFYDLESGPVTYDFVQFLVLAEKFRLLSGRRHLHVVFVPGRHQGFRNLTPRDQFLSEARKEWRLYQLLMRACHLLPACAGATRLQSRDEVNAILARVADANVFPTGYSLANPICPYLLSFLVKLAGFGPDVRALVAPPLALALVRNFYRELAGDAPVVTITLRQSDFQPQRNSRLCEWLAFARSCRARGYCPIFVPDTEAVLQDRPAGVDEFPVFTLAALSIPIRMAAYEASWHNMMANSGPYTLCLYNPRVRYSMFKLLVPDVQTTSAAYHAGQGIMPGTQLPFAGPLQRWVWEDDSLDAIEREFALVAAHTEAQQPQRGAVA